MSLCKSMRAAVSVCTSMRTEKDREEGLVKSGTRLPSRFHDKITVRDCFFLSKETPPSSVLTT